MGSTPRVVLRSLQELAHERCPGARRSKFVMFGEERSALFLVRCFPEMLEHFSGKTSEGTGNIAVPSVWLWQRGGEARCQAGLLSTLRGQQLTGLVGAAHRDVLTRREQQPGHLSQGAGLLSSQVLQTRHQCSDVAFEP